MIESLVPARHRHGNLCRRCITFPSSRPANQREWDLNFEGLGFRPRSFWPPGPREGPGAGQAGGCGQAGRWFCSVHAIG